MKAFKFQLLDPYENKFTFIVTVDDEGFISYKFFSRINRQRCALSNLQMTKALPDHISEISDENQIKQIIQTGVYSVESIIKLT